MSKKSSKSHWFTLRRHDLGSSFAKLVWTAIFCSITIFSLASISFVDVEKKEEMPPQGWDVIVRIKMSTEEAALLEGIVASVNPSGVVTYTANGSIKYVSSASVTKDLRNPSEVPVSSILSYVVMRTTDQSGLDSTSVPWFNEEMLQEGSLSAPDPLVLDAETAQELQVGVGSSLHLECDLTDPETLEATTVAWDKTVTAIVQPTRSFRGIYANLPEVRAYVEEAYGPTGLTAYVHGVSESDAQTIVTAFNQGIDDSGPKAFLATDPMAFGGTYSTQQTLSQQERQQRYVIAAIALTVMVAMALFDARTMGRLLVARAQAVGLRARAAVMPCLLEAAGVIIACGAAGTLVTVLALLAESQSRSWAIRPALSTPLLICGGVALLIVVGRLAILALCARKQSRDWDN